MGAPLRGPLQDALYRITAESRGLTGLAIQLGPFGGSGAGGANLPVFATAYFLAVLGMTLAAFAPQRSLAGADAVSQHADPLDLELDHVPRLQPAAVAVLEDAAGADGARAEDVAGAELRVACGLGDERVP